MYYMYYKYSILQTIDIILDIFPQAYGSNFMKQNVRNAICIFSDNSIFKEWTSLSLAKRNLDISFLPLDKLEVKTNSKNYDLYLIDIHSNYMRCLDLVDSIKKKNSNNKIITIIDGGNKDFMNLIYKSQIDGMVSAHEIKADCLNILVEKVLNGEMYISEKYKDIILQNVRENNQIKKELSRREIQIVSLLGSGKSSIQIAELLHCSPKTVNVHRSNIKEKLNIKHNHDFIKYCYESTK